MCGRVNVSDHHGVQQLLDFLDIPLYPDKFVSHYNIAPGAQLFSAFSDSQTYQGAYMTWGILPNWAKPEKFSRPLINARSETVWEKPSFHNLVKSQRIIIPINGFYEWKRDKNVKIAHHIHASNQPALALAGLYQISKDGILQCCIITTAANNSMSEVHDRMPVILETGNFNDWLKSDDKNLLNSLMTPCPNQAISIDKVSFYVNNAKNDGPKCLQASEQISLF